MESVSVKAYPADSHPLRIARKMRGWTEEELARAAGIAQSTVARIERGDRMPSTDTLAKLAGALGLSELSDLLRPWVKGEAG